MLKYINLSAILALGLCGRCKTSQSQDSLHCDSNGNVWTSDTNTIVGKRNGVFGEYNDVEGKKNLVQGDDNQVIGSKNTVSGQGNVIQGEGNVVLSGDSDIDIDSLLPEWMRAGNSKPSKKTKAPTQAVTAKNIQSMFPAWMRSDNKVKPVKTEDEDSSTTYVPRQQPKINKKSKKTSAPVFDDFDIESRFPKWMRRGNSGRRNDANYEEEEPIRDVFSSNVARSGYQARPVYNNDGYYGPYYQAPNYYNGPYSQVQQRGNPWDFGRGYGGGNKRYQQNLVEGSGNYVNGYGNQIGGGFRRSPGWPFD